MKNEKGEAAFDSTDDVLAKRIINTTEKHGQDEAPANSASDFSFDEENTEPAEKKVFRGKGILIAACTGIVLLIIGIFMFRRRK